MAMPSGDAAGFQESRSVPGHKPLLEELRSRHRWHTGGVQGRSVAKRVLAQGDRLFPTPTGVTVLIYHRVGGGSGSEVDLDLDAFRAQLAHLAAHHRVLTLDAAVERLSAGTSTDNAVVVTFDDGTADFCEHVVPALVEAGVPATLYAATHFIDSGAAFPWGAAPASWAGLRDAVSTGLVTIGSHTHTHPLLDRFDPAQIADELDRSIELIGEHIGTRRPTSPTRRLCRARAAAEAEVRQRFTSAALARSRVNQPGKTDVHRLWRTPIQRSDGHDYFVRKAAGGMRTRR